MDYDLAVTLCGVSGVLGRPVEVGVSAGPRLPYHWLSDGIGQAGADMCQALSGTQASFKLQGLNFAMD